MSTVVGLLVLVAAGTFIVPFWAQRRHVAVLQCIDGHARSVVMALHSGSSPAENLHGDDRTRAEVLMAVNTALWNPLYHRERTSPEKLRAIADNLDNTNGADLRTGEGCLRLMAAIEDACPEARDYVWFVNVRAMQDKGTVARLKGKP